MRAPKTVGEIESFITMLLAACENRMVYDRLEGLLSLPDLRRQSEVIYKCRRGEAVK